MGSRWYGILPIIEDSGDGGSWSGLVPEGVPWLVKGVCLRKHTHLVSVDPGPMDLPRKGLCSGVSVDGGGVPLGQAKLSGRDVLESSVPSRDWRDSPWEKTEVTLPFEAILDPQN